MSDKTVYVPGKTDLYSLPKDILISLFTSLEEDITQHLTKKIKKDIKGEMKELEEEREELEFQLQHCYCEYTFVKCSVDSCQARALIDGKYGSTYDKCSDMVRCEQCEYYSCDDHICPMCQFCLECCLTGLIDDPHEYCESCELYLCPRDTHKPKPWIKGQGGDCRCGSPTEEILLFFCKNCKPSGDMLKKGILKTLPKVKYSLVQGDKPQCETCNSFYCVYSFKTNICHQCKRKSIDNDGMDCSKCGFKSHRGCIDIEFCSNCEERVCPKCIQKCEICKDKVCANCKEHCCRCDVCDQKAVITWSDTNDKFLCANCIIARDN
jgi:hypothetical protein